VAEVSRDDATTWVARIAFFLGFFFSGFAWLRIRPCGLLLRGVAFLSFEQVLLLGFGFSRSVWRFTSTLALASRQFLALHRRAALAAASFSSRLLESIANLLEKTLLFFCHYNL
jgi:hypothetical protein